MTRTVEALHPFMPQQFGAATKVLLSLVENLESNQENDDALQYLFIPEYVERYGLEDLDNAIVALERITQFITCEFAIRPFIVKYPQAMEKQMLAWTAHSHRRVRRLASEGCRPRLPWGMAISTYKQDPTNILPILEALKDDECEVVRRSVANNFNDIAKDNPKVVIDFATSNIGVNTPRDKLIKHACRTLLKQAEPNVMALFGFDSQGIELTHFSLAEPQVKVGGEINFEFEVHNQTNQSKKLRLEYGIYYQKHNGTLSRKVFKISEREISAGELYKVTRKQSFKIITTRKFHPGLHQVSIILNGQEWQRLDFELLD
ncbi:DNA alkylation repair protein [Vibrio sp. SCSIO 43136]|nr:DNA alkylation repair protein [Vibrio sp. SCSIO 43136]